MSAPEDRAPHHSNSKGKLEDTPGLGSKVRVLFNSFDHVHQRYVLKLSRVLFYLMQVEMGWAFTFRASCWSHRNLYTPRHWRVSSELLSGPMEAWDSHVPLSLGRDGSYSGGCVLLVGFTIGGFSHWTSSGNIYWAKWYDNTFRGFVWRCSGLCLGGSWT